MLCLHSIFNILIMKINTLRHIRGSYKKAANVILTLAAWVLIHQRVLI